MTRHTVELLNARRLMWRERLTLFGAELDENAFVLSTTPDASTPYPPNSISQRYRRMAAKLGLRSTRLHYSLRHYSQPSSSPQVLTSALWPAAKVTAAVAQRPCGSTRRGSNKLIEPLPERLGVWGTSFAGGHALLLGATDRRLGCVVAQVPTTSGFEQGRRRVSPDDTLALEESFQEEDRAVLSGEAPRYMAIASAAPDVPAAYHAPDAGAFHLLERAIETWTNEVTLCSIHASRMYEPSASTPLVSPTPLLMVVVALGDPLTTTDLQLVTHEQALEPKGLATLTGACRRVHVRVPHRCRRRHGLVRDAPPQVVPAAATPASPHMARHSTGRTRVPTPPTATPVRQR